MPRPSRRQRDERDARIDCERAFCCGRQPQIQRALRDPGPGEQSWWAPRAPEFHPSSATWS